MKKAFGILALCACCLGLLLSCNKKSKEEQVLEKAQELYNESLDKTQELYNNAMDQANDLVNSYNDAVEDLGK